MNNNSFNALDYLYYRTTILYQKIEGNSGFEANKDRGVWAVSICIILNIMTVLLFFGTIFLKEDIKKLGDYTVFKYFLFAIPVIIFILSHYYFARKNHEVIFNNYKNETAKQKENRGIIVIAYIIFSFALALCFAAIGSDKIQEWLSIGNFYLPQSHSQRTLRTAYLE